MVRTLLRAPLRLHRITVSTPSVLCCRTPISRSLYPAGQRSYASQKKSETKSQKKSQKHELPERCAGLGEEKCTLELTRGPASMSYIRLRDLCQCPTCVDPYSKQRNFRTSDIPPDIKAKSLKWEDDMLWATWENDLPGFDSSHVSVYSMDQLKSPDPYLPAQSVSNRRFRAHWDRQNMQGLQHWIAYRDYMHDDERFTIAMRFFAMYGLLFVKDIPESREMVEQIAARIGPLRNTFYGMTWDVRQVPQARNVAYTSQFLGFHMDLMYMAKPPAVQFLHCLKNSCDGGESLFVDSFKVANWMYRNCREEYEVLKHTFLNYRYHHQDHSYSRSRPVFEESKIPGEVKCVNYSPPFQGPGTELPGTKTISVEQQRKEIRALKVFADLLEDQKFIFQLKLNPGDCVIFDNRRIVHARNQFNTASGERWLAGAYLDDDVLLSRFRVLRDAYPNSWHAKWGNNKTLKDMHEGTSVNPSAPAWSLSTMKEPQSVVDQGGDTDVNPSLPAWAIPEESQESSQLDEEVTKEFAREAEQLDEEPADVQETQTEEQESRRWLLPSARPGSKAGRLDQDDFLYHAQNEPRVDSQNLEGQDQEQPNSSTSASAARPDTHSVLRDAFHTLNNPPKQWEAETKERSKTKGSKRSERTSPKA